MKAYLSITVNGAEDVYTAKFRDSDRFILETITKNREVVLFDFNNQIDQFFNTTEYRVDFINRSRSATSPHDLHVLFEESVYKHELFNAEKLKV